MVTVIIEQTLSVFDPIRMSLRAMQKYNDYYQMNSNNILWMANQYEAFLKSMNILNEIGNITTKTELPNGDYKAHINEINLEDLLRKLDLTTQWTVNPTTKWFVK